MIAWQLLICAGAAGLCLGSFTTTAALRTVRGESFVGGRSRCDACGQDLSFAATLPLWGFATRRGACSHCGGSIDPIHLFGEIIGALLTTLPLVIAGPVRGGLLAALGLILLVASVIDLRSQRLPDLLTVLAAAICGFLAWMPGPGAFLEGMFASLLTGIVLVGSRFAYRRWRGIDGLGLGDVKLLSALALWLGAGTPWAVCLAAVLGLVTFKLVRPAVARVPFGPFIAAGAMCIGLIQEVAGWPLRL